MLVCNCCGKVIEGCEAPRERIVHGATSLGADLVEVVMGSCDCGGEFVEATKCSVCGEWFDNSNLYGVCECCLEEAETVGTSIEIGRVNRADVSVNGFIATVLSADKINAILEKWVEENFTDHSRDVVEYCEDDKSYFSEWVESHCKE